VASWADQLGIADHQVVPTIAWVDSEGYRGTPLRLRGNVIARLLRPQPERASLPQHSRGAFFVVAREAQGRPLTAIADAIGAHRISHESVAGTLKTSQPTRRIGSIRRRPAFMGYEANGHIGKRP
jgi:hypothetical protein